MRQELQRPLNFLFDDVRKYYLTIAFLRIFLKIIFQISKSVSYVYLGNSTAQSSIVNKYAAHLENENNISHR